MTGGAAATGVPLSEGQLDTGCAYAIPPSPSTVQSCFLSADLKRAQAPACAVAASRFSPFPPYLACSPDWLSGLTAERKRSRDTLTGSGLLDSSASDGTR